MQAIFFSISDKFFFLNFQVGTRCTSAGTTATRSWANSTRILRRTSWLRSGHLTACMARRRRFFSRLRKAVQVRAYQQLLRQVGTLGPNCPLSPTGRQCFPSPSTTSPDSNFGLLSRLQPVCKRKNYIPCDKYESQCKSK